MDVVLEFFKGIKYEKVVGSIVIVIIAILIYKIATYILGKSEANDKLKLFTSNKGKTYIKLMKSIIRYVIMILTGLIILQINGVNVSSVLAGVGIFGVVFGFAIQDWLKDIIRGSSIISDDYFKVGDIVKYNDIEGKVLVIGLKTTKIKDIKTSNIISIANRKIEEVEIVSNLIYVRIPMPYEVKVEKAEKAVDDILNLIKGNNNVNGCRYLGITELADSSIHYLVEVNCNPQNKLQVRRDTIKSIVLGLDKNNIEVPYTQIDIHNK